MCDINVNESVGEPITRHELTHLFGQVLRKKTASGINENIGTVRRDCHECMVFFTNRAVNYDAAIDKYHSVGLNVTT